MTTIHTYRTPQGTVETRKSKTRQYAACLVLVVTEKAIEGHKAEVEACEKAEAEAKAVLATLLAERNTTLAEAKAQAHAESYDIDGKSYYSLWSDEQDAVATEWGVEDGVRYRQRNEIEAEAKGRLTAKGILDPHRKEGPGTVDNAGRGVEVAESNLSRARERLAATKVGNEEVVSWHLTVNNAVKAMGNPAEDHTVKKDRYGHPRRKSEAARLRLLGYRVETRFNRQTLETSEAKLAESLKARGDFDRKTFDVRETQPRTKKAS